MNVDTTNLNHLWSSLIVEELSRLGVRRAVISPGSRSTPLVVAASRCDRMQTTVHFDERGAAFYALGLARAMNTPTVLICTSGTAAANFLPAVIESSQDRVPLILLTADRPPELRDAGANQTILQPGLFGNYVRWQFDMPCPTTEIDPTMVLSTIDQAVYRATASPAGPVHINCMFREPLAPIDDNCAYDQYRTSLAQWESSNAPFTAYTQAHSSFEASLTDVKQAVASARRGLIVLGRLARKEDAAAAMNLSHQLDWPMIPDIQSQVRLGNNGPNTVCHADLILSAEPIGDQLAPDVIIHLGDQIVSKRSLQLCALDSCREIIRITDHPFRHDPDHRVTHRVIGPVAAACTELMNVRSAAPDSYRQCWQSAETVASEVLDKMLTGDVLSEPALAFNLSRLLARDSALFLASSLAIRNFDSFAASDGAPVVVAANRGASGIDGTIASAAGFASGIGRPLTLVIGDLALLHDLNSLELVRRSAVPITIVLLNNDGGAIFGLLPVAEAFEELEKYFVAPHGLQFAHAAFQFGLSYAAPTSMKEFAQAYSLSAGKMHTLIELLIDRHADRHLRRHLLESIRDAVSVL